MATWQYDMVMVPREPLSSNCRGVSSVVPPNLFDSQNWWAGRCGPDESELSAILPASTSWSGSVKTWGASDGNRIEMYFEDGQLFEIKIRIDLRNPPRQFVNDIVELAARHNCLFWTEEAKLLEPVYDAVVSDIAESAAFLFVREPLRFLKRFTSKKMLDG